MIIIFSCESKTSQESKDLGTLLNKDDGAFEKLQRTLTHQKLVTYGIRSAVDVSPKSFPFTSRLPGEFNTYNMLAAIAVCTSLGISNEKIKDGLASFTLPLGRMNMIKNGMGMDIFVDYAHTPNALTQALTTLNSMRKKNSKIISIIGAEGYRDIKKRPKLGEIAMSLSDRVIITSVDPRGLMDEINKAILTGAKKAGGELGKNVFIEPDRQKAIDMAIHTLGKKGDIIGIFGKGHERSMNMDGKHELPWSDYEAVETALRARA